MEELTDEEYNSKLLSRKKTRGVKISPRGDHSSPMPDQISSPAFIEERQENKPLLSPAVSTENEVKSGWRSVKSLTLLQPEKIKKKKKVQIVPGSISLKKPIINEKEEKKEEGEKQENDVNVLNEKKEEIETEQLKEETKQDKPNNDEEIKEVVLKEEVNQQQETISKQKEEENMKEETILKEDKKEDIKSVSEDDIKIKPVNEVSEEPTEIKENKIKNINVQEEEQEELMIRKKRSTAIQNIVKSENRKSKNLSNDEYDNLLQLRKEIKKKQSEIENKDIEEINEEETITEEEYLELIKLRKKKKKKMKDDINNDISINIEQVVEEEEEEEEKEEISNEEYEELMRLRKGLKEKNIEVRRKTYVVSKEGEEIQIARKEFAQMITNCGESVGQFLVRGHKVLLVFLRYLGSMHTQYILEEIYKSHESLLILDVIPVIVYMEEEEVGERYFTKSRLKYSKILRISDITFKSLFDFKEYENIDNINEFKGYKDIKDYTPESSNGYVTKNHLLGIYFINENFKIESSLIQKEYDDFDAQLLEMVFQPEKSKNLFNYLNLKNENEKEMVNLIKKDFLQEIQEKKKKKNFFLNFDFLKSQQESNETSSSFNQVELIDIILEDQWNPYFILFSAKQNILSFLLFYELIIFINQKQDLIISKQEEKELYISFILNTFFNPISIFDLDLPLKIKHLIESSKNESNFKYFDDIISNYIQPHITKLYQLFLKSDLYLEMIFKFSIEHQKMSLEKELEIGSPRQINFDEKITSPRQSKKEIKKKKKLEKELEEKEEFIEFKNDLYGMSDYQRFILDVMGKVIFRDDFGKSNQEMEFELDQMSKEIDDIEFN
eukprot:gene8863-812_t